MDLKPSTNSVRKTSSVTIPTLGATHVNFSYEKAFHRILKHFVDNEKTIKKFTTRVLEDDVSAFQDFSSIKKLAQSIDVLVNNLSNRMNLEMNKPFIGLYYLFHKKQILWIIHSSYDLHQDVISLEYCYNRSGRGLESSETLMRLAEKYKFMEDFIIEVHDPKKTDFESHLQHHQVEHAKTQNSVLQDENIVITKIPSTKNFVPCCLEFKICKIIQKFFE